MDKPNREPDFEFECYFFYFREMVQWNTTDSILYPIRLARSGRIKFFSRSHETWCDYNVEDRDPIYDAYINWQVETILLE